MEGVVDELYAMAPEEFTVARTAAAKADPTNAKQIRALRKPTVGAWLVNNLVRVEPELLEQLLVLGPELAAAQQGGDADALRQLGGQRRQLVAAVADRAFQSAGRQPTAATRAEVESTLEAALADQASADAVRSGCLTRALSYAGFGGVDLEGAVATGPGRPAARAKKSGPPPTAKPDRSKDIATAEIRAHDAAGALDDAVRQCQQAQSDQDRADASAKLAADSVAAADETLRAAREAKLLAEQRARKAAHVTERAAAAVAEAQKKAEKARAALDKLRRG